MVANLRTRDAADENANDYYYMCENAATMSFKSFPAMESLQMNARAG